MSETKKEIKTIYEVKSMVKELNFPQDLFQRLEIAKKFISEELAGFESEEAEMILNISMKQHFSFDKESLNMLKKHYQKSRKEFLIREKYGDSFEKFSQWYKVTEKGLKFLPGILACHLAENEKLICVNSSYYQYQNGVYSLKNSSHVSRLIQGKMLMTESTAYAICDTEKQLQLLVQREPEELNVNPYLINLKNGFYDVLTDTFSAHNPAVLSTIQINANYGEATCPKFIQFLYESMCGHEDQVFLLQEIMGYCLIPNTCAQKCFILLGKAAAGKSLFLNVLQDILIGPQNTSNISWQKMKERFATAELFGKLINIFADLPDGALSDNGIFKTLVGEDYVPAEKKHKDMFHFKSTARILFSCNQMPENNGDNSDGFYRRLLIVPFVNSVPEEQRNPNLLNEFREEADGIFMFALEGLKRLIAQNFKFSETEINRLEVHKYRYESNPVFLFLQSCCEESADEYIRTEDLYTAYKNFCTESGCAVYAVNKFVTRVKAYFPNVISGVDTKGQKRILKGIKLR